MTSTFPNARIPVFRAALPLQQIGGLTHKHRRPGVVDLASNVVPERKVELRE
jgi:hypothetical protein